MFLQPLKDRYRRYINNEDFTFDAARDSTTPDVKVLHGLYQLIRDKIGREAPQAPEFLRRPR